MQRHGIWLVLAIAFLLPLELLAPIVVEACKDLAAWVRRRRHPPVQ